MAGWNTSSLTASDVSFHPPRHRTGLVKNTKDRVSKQDMMEKKMFGKKKKMSKMSSGHKSGGVNPSPEEFDDMMKSSVTHDMKKKKSLFSRKQFG